MDPQHHFTNEYQALRHSEEYMAKLARVWSAPNEEELLVELLKRLIRRYRLYKESRQIRSAQFRARPAVARQSQLDCSSLNLEPIHDKKPDSGQLASGG